VHVYLEGNIVSIVCFVCRVSPDDYVTGIRRSVEAKDSRGCPPATSIGLSAEYRAARVKGPRKSLSS